MRITTILLFSLLFSFSCQRPHKNQFESFFEQTFNVIKYNSVLKDSLNWVDLKKTVKDSIKNFNSNDDAYNAIDYTVHLVNDGHSIFLVGEKPSNKTPPIDNNPITDRLFTPHIDSKIIDKEIGYIKLTGFSAINDSLQKQYTLEVRKALLTLDSTGELSGWIINLRTHGGGRMSSESLGLSPLFENELIGYAKETKNELIEISSTKSKLSNGNYIQETLNYDSTLINKNKKIAVLIDKNTVSSGEFLALAFKFQSNTITIGKPTRGKTSHLGLYQLRDNVLLLLAKSYYYDINKNVIHSGLIPDLECDIEHSLSKAIEWIKS